MRDYGKVYTRFWLKISDRNNENRARNSTVAEA